jgi:ribose transport system permease protein
MIRLAGVLILLVTLYVTLFASNPGARGASNLIELANRQGLFGVLTLAVGLLMVAGGIDLSLGSVVALGAVSFAILMEKGVHPMASLAITLLMGMIVGLINGGLVTVLKLQSFLVTLCGLFVYRGLARLIANEKEVGISRITKQLQPAFQEPLDTLRYYLVGQAADGEVVFPATMVVMLLLAVVLGLILHLTVYGRHWYAIGYNEKAARYAGISVVMHQLGAYVICSTLGAFTGVLLLLFYGTAKPDSAGQAYELEAITGAVLGGVSLRGGQGTVFGMVLGAMVLPLLRNLVTFLGIPDAIIPAVIGMTLLIGTIIDELIRRKDYTSLFAFGGFLTRLVGRFGS